MGGWTQGIGSPRVARPLRCSRYVRHDGDMTEGDEARPAAPQPQEPTDAQHVTRKINEQPTVAPGKWVKRMVLALVVAAVLFIVWRLSAAFWPRWWAQRVGDQVEGGVTAGTMWGLFYGFTFTFVPLLLLFQIRRRFFTWTWRGIVAVVAVVLAAPNWLTFMVVAGNSNAAHAGERIFDVEAPGFRWATLIGVVVGGLLAIVTTGTSMRLSNRRKQIDKLKAERDQLRTGNRDRGDEETSES